jgi:hypothetical protein
MVFKVIAFIKKKDGLSAEEFQRYYEERHVAMSNSHGLLPPTLYKRNFLKKGDEINRQDHLLEDVDCITEVRPVRPRMVWTDDERWGSRPANITTGGSRSSSRAHRAPAFEPVERC